MRQLTKTKGSAAKRAFGQIAAEKKKAVLAVGLIAFMAILWIRVITKKDTAAAKAITPTQLEASMLSSKQESKLHFVELPKIKGRNDILNRDFFAADGWNAFRGNDGAGNIKQVDVISEESSEDWAKRIAAKLRLQAIVTGKIHQAFVNNKLVSVGDKFFVTDRAEKYECEVTEISENKVSIECSKAKFDLKLRQTTKDDL
ncbi:MAG: hypothetical protein JXB29_10945 [Sedimentisphaerales bacterium]|nr:hypothetical protein [Sedimentisphaerales bacterium]